MRVLNWNISHGGGTRIAEICRHVEDVSPDLLALTEFQTRNEETLRTYLARLGYPFIITSKPTVNQNGILVASKWQLEVADARYAPDVDRERWLAVRLDRFDLDVLVLHIPGATDNKFADGYGISGVKRKELFWECIVNYAAEHRSSRAIMMGDFNTGFRIDAEGAMFTLSHYMTKLVDTGFVDTWRHLHPHVRDFTWYSKRRDKATGNTEDLNGFRLDYIFVSPALEDAVTDVAIQHNPRKTGASDHASVMANIGILADRGQPIPLRRREASAEAMRNDEPVDSVIGETFALQDGPVAIGISVRGNHRVRFEFAPGSVPDMACGLNTQAFVQWFRPTYVTVEWAGGVLKNVQVWGPRRLQDGSLGKRVLDHQWKTSVAAGGVKYSDLPATVAELLRSYITGTGQEPKK